MQISRMAATGWLPNVHVEVMVSPGPLTLLVLLLLFWGLLDKGGWGWLRSPGRSTPAAAMLAGSRLWRMSLHIHTQVHTHTYRGVAGFYRPAGSVLVR